MRHLLAKSLAILVIGVLIPTTALAVSVIRTKALAINVSIPLLFSYRVIQQPRNDAGFVSLEGQRVTEFGQAFQSGSRGLLADNKLAGSIFSSVGLGNIITVDYADNTHEDFVVTRLRHFQALSPTSPYSNFIDLATGDFYTTRDLFDATYGLKGILILQTCIAKDNEWAWGRMFIVGTYLEPYPLVVPPNHSRIR